MNLPEALNQRRKVKHEVAIATNPFVCQVVARGQGKKTFGIQVKLPPVYHTRRRLHYVSLIADSWKPSMESNEYQL